MLLEDAAQAHLAALDGQPVGTWGEAAAFSFYPTKNMTAGEGGMISTRDERTADRARLLRNQGQQQRYSNEVVGLNNRMTDIHAAIGRVQLAALPDRTKQRQANAARLSQELRNVVVPSIAPGATHVFHQYTIRAPGHDRERFIEQLAIRGVEARAYYPTPVHRLPSFGVDTHLPVTEQAAREVMSLPVYPSLSDGELDDVIDAVNTVAAAGS